MLSTLFERNNYSIYQNIHDSIYFNNYLYALIVLAYLPVIFGIQYYMKNKKGYKNELSNNLLYYWNLFLSTFSGIGCVILSIYLYDQLIVNNTPLYNVKFYNNLVASYVIILFGFSKFFEFIDTLFIVFRKSQLEFIHWYHHIITCIYCWHTSHIIMNTAIYFTIINLFVHTIMYFYYALMAANNYILYPIRKVITVIQILQMVIGVLLCSLWYKYTENYTTAESFNNLFALLMYFSYFILFIKVFFRTKYKST